MAKKHSNNVPWDGGFGGGFDEHFDGDFDTHYTKGNYTPCHVSHPALKIGDYQIYGGSCVNPKVKDAGVYIGFDWNMALTPPPYPWEKPEPHDWVEVLFQIPDMGIPSNAKQFHKLVEWTAEQLKAGKKVHAGCVGGHGRTGMFLAALVTYMTGEKDSITYVRKNYCQKAVENAAQVNFLHKEFGITKVGGSKKPVVVYDSKGYTPPKSMTGGSKHTLTPVPSQKDVWKQKRVFDKPNAK
jgi:hypothetical protein